MENKYEYAVHPSGKIIFRGKNIFGGPSDEVFYKGLSNWKENDDYDLVPAKDWIASEDETLKAAMNLGMLKENFYK